MANKRAGGIVAAVTITITVAFMVIAIMFFNTSVNVASRYAESSADLYAWEIQSELDGFIHSQYALVRSSLLDDQILDVLERERQGMSSESTARELRRTLERLVVDEEASFAFVTSSATEELYLSDGEHMHVEVTRDLERYVKPDDVEDSDGVVAKDTSASYVMSMPTGKDGEAQTLVGRALFRDGDLMGVVGTGVRASALQAVALRLRSDTKASAVCFAADGTVLFSTNAAVVAGSNVFDDFSHIASIRKQLKGSSTQAQRVWAGLDGPLPRGQVLYLVRYSPELDAYLLFIDPAEDIFAMMRARVTTLVLALCVVMVLLLLLVMFIVRWYRTRLVEAATTDELTGLANRKSFVAHYEAHRARQELDDATLVLIDVDKFKQVNDTYGHAVGDRALAAVAEQVRAITRDGGSAGRWGGDEFIAVLCMGHDAALARVQSMIDAVRAMDVGGGVHVTVSVGTARVYADESMERAVERADDALYVTKDGGRGFLTDYCPGVTPHVSNAPDVVGVPADDASRAQDAVEVPTSVPARGRKEGNGARRLLRQNLATLLDVLIDSLLDAVRKMVPFVAGGGILIAIAFLVDGASVDMQALDAEARAAFGSITPIAAGLSDVGKAAFNFMLPIFAAFFARGLAGDEAFMAGFAGGYLASQGSAGFLGAIAAAVVAAAVVSLMSGFVRETFRGLQHVAPVLLYPVFSLLIMYLLMAFVIDPAATAFDTWLTSLLVALSKGSRQVLGAACGAMMATDMGGPINKAAYHFGTAAIQDGNPDIMAAVMVGGMVPPCGIALSMLLFANRYTRAQRDQGAATCFMGLSFITEGAIPFVLTDIVRVIPSCMLGSAVAGALSEAFGCTLMAPHGGIFVFPVVGNAPLYLVSLLVGSLVTAVALGLLKRPVPAE